MFGYVINIGREMMLAHYYGVNIELEVFRLYLAVPTAVVGLVSEAYISILVAFVASRGIDEFKFINEKCVSILSILSVLIYLVSFPLQHKYLFQGYELTTSLELVLGLCVYVFICMKSLGKRMYCVCRNRRGLSTLYMPIVFTIFIFLNIIAIDLLGSLPSHSSLIYALTLSSLVSFVLYGALTKYVVGDQGCKHFKESIKVRKDIISALCGLAVLVFFKVINVFPRFIDRKFLSVSEQGSLAAIEYSYVLLSLPVSFVSMLVVYLLLPVIVNRNFSLVSIVKFVVLLVGVGCVLTVVLRHTFPYFIAKLLVRGKFDGNSLQKVLEFYDIHVFATGPLLIGICLAAVLVHMGRYIAVVFAAFAKLVSKIYLISNLSVDASATEVGRTLVISEYALVISMLIFLVYHLWNRRI